MMAQPETVRLGRFTVDVAAGDLMQDTERVPLRPQTAQLLALLARRPGRVISRDEIRAALWDDEVVDHESGINACVRELRRALDDDARAPRFLETVPKRGYRLIMPPDAADAEPAMPLRSRSVRRALAAAGFLGLVLLTAITIRGSTSTSSTVVVLAPIAGTPQAVRSAALALIDAVAAHPDARRVRIVTERPGDVFDPAADALMRADVRIPADLLLEPSADDGALRFYLYRPSDDTMLWTTRVPLDSLHRAIPILARALRSAGG